MSLHTCCSLVLLLAIPSLQERREVKKMNKTAYKKEELRVSKQLLHAPATANVV